MFVEKLKNFIPQVVLVIISTTLSLAALEGGLRMLNIPPKPIVPKGCEQLWKDAFDARDYADLHGVYHPNSTQTLCTSEFRVTYHIDSNGYLGRVKPDGKQQPLLVIGDSFAFGFGVQPDESFAGRLDAYNAGLWGNSFPLHALAFEQIVDIVKPRQVIWAIYPPHLISVSNRRWNTLDSFDQDAHPIFTPLVGFYNQTSLSSLILESTGWGINRPDPYTREWSLYDEQDSSLDKGYRAFEQAVKKVTHLAQERNIQLIPVFIPSKTRLKLEVDGIRPPLLHFGHTLQGDLPTNRMSEILVKYGVPASNQIDAFDLFKDGSIDWHTSYFVLDGHLNVQGNQYLANLIQRHLNATK